MAAATELRKQGSIGATMAVETVGTPRMLKTPPLICSLVCTPIPLWRANTSQDKGQLLPSEIALTEHVQCIIYGSLVPETICASMMALSMASAQVCVTSWVRRSQQSAGDDDDDDDGRGLTLSQWMRHTSWLTRSSSFSFDFPSFSRRA